ncbi:unnamed protein product [Amoebophrya sp. A120]|nr:unnamed protein product [Amoebophrya sp. A120]|eukprot:GSA120T00008904001.1
MIINTNCNFSVACASQERSKSAPQIDVFAARWRFAWSRPRRQLVRLSRPRRCCRAGSRGGAVASRPRERKGLQFFADRRSSATVRTCCRRRRGRGRMRPEICFPLGQSENGRTCGRT